MTDIEQCYGDIIGTKKDTNSDSGLYITDLEALSTLDGLVGEDFEDIDTILADAKRIAILSFNTDITSRLMRFAKPRGSFRGKIGSSRYKTTRTADGEKGVRILCAPLKHAQLHLYSVGVLLPQAGSVDVYLSSNHGEEETVIATITAVKNKVVTEDLDLTYYIQDDMTDNVEFYIYHKQASYVVNRIKCSGCGRPFYFEARYPRYSYGGYAMIGGFVGDIDDYATNSMNGIVLGAEFRCRVDRIVCDNLNFQTNPMAQAYAQAIHLKAGSVVLWNIIRSSKLNRVLMQDIETFREAASYYERKYRDEIIKIGKTMPVEGCFCEHGFSRVWK